MNRKNGRKENGIKSSFLPSQSGKPARNVLPRIGSQPREQMAELTGCEVARQNPAVAGVQSGVAPRPPKPAPGGTESAGLKAIVYTHE